ncbi:hypothetical protein QUF99_02375 [Bacillus sp. DX4.1]|uniref:hypothetical protein n=1 Tax=Bacillus sp. DX4.1 TaxID=3055867 RepID=UPI0025A027CB|nr:hypothetical protein [Bacillus sp. DX4.1]MDM5186301.1 hypothetical protein [Bacillus sp. DX4.1]
MTYGIHSIEVEEVIQFSRMFQFSGLTQELLKDIKVIKDIDKATFLAYEATFGDDEYTWNDIRELEMSEVWGDYYNLNEDERSVGLDALTDLIDEHVRKSDNGLSDFFHDVVADLRNCAINRAINGKSNNFFEKILEIYKIGGFPCGWDEEYSEGNPKGNFIVYMAEME